MEASIVIREDLENKIKELERFIKEQVKILEKQQAFVDVLRKELVDVKTARRVLNDIVKEKNNPHYKD